MTADPRGALANLMSAFERHLEASSSKSGEDDPTVIAAYDDLADAFAEYDDALLQAYGEMTPLDIYDGEGDDETTTTRATTSSTTTPTRIATAASTQGSTTTTKRTTTRPEPAARAGSPRSGQADTSSRAETSSSGSSSDSLASDVRS